MSIAKRIISQTGFQLIGKVISSLITLFSLSLITSYYGIAETGLYTLVLTYLAFFYLAADLGLNAYALPLFGQKDRLFSKVLGFRLLLSFGLVIVALIGAVFMPQMSPGFFLGVLIGVFSIVFNAVFVTTNLVFQKRYRYDLSVLAASLSSFISGVIIWILILNNFPISELLFATLGGWFICASVSLLLVNKYTHISLEIDLSFIKKAITNMWPISATLLLNVFYFRVDTFMINYFKSLNEVGVYNFAYQFFQTALVLPTFIMNILYPLLIEKENNSPTLLKRFILQAFTIMVLIGVLGSVVTWILSPFIIQLVAYSGGFESSVQVLRILGLSFPAFFGSAVLMWSLVTFRLNQKMLLVYLIGLLVNISLNFLFIPIYSFIAASWVTVGCEYLIVLMQSLILVNYLRKNPAR